MNQDTFEAAKDLVKKSENSKSTAIISGIAGLVPYFGGLLSPITAEMLSDFQKKKRQDFLSIIISKEQLITSKMVNDVEFIINFIKTLEAVNRLAANDKVVYFAKLLKNSYFTSDKINASEYDEYLTLLSELSYREIYLLIEYNRQCGFNIICSDGSSTLKESQDKFIQEMSKQFKCSNGTIADILYKLESKGLCTFQAHHGYRDEDECRIFGVATDYYKGLSKRIV